MPDLIPQIVAMFGVSGVFAGAATYIIQKFLSSKIESHFSAIERRLDGLAEISLSLRKARLQQVQVMLPHLQAKASHCRNQWQLFCQLKGSRELEMFNARRMEFADQLYATQLLLSPEAYDCAHLLKGAFDSVSALVGGAANINSEPIRVGMSNGTKRIDRFYSELASKLRELLESAEKAL